jgi:hypothetical protein
MTALKSPAISSCSLSARASVTSWDTYVYISFRIACASDQATSTPRSMPKVNPHNVSFHFVAAHGSACGQPQHCKRQHAP